MFNEQDCVLGVELMAWQEPRDADVVVVVVALVIGGMSLMHIIGLMLRLW